MLKKNITYTNFDGETVTETFYFNLSKTELIELEAHYDNGLEKAIRRIIETKDTKTLIAEFKRIILLSYGEKSEDGRRFIKSDHMRYEFEQTAAFDTLFTELATNDNAAVEFLQAVVPKDLPVPDAPMATQQNVLPSQPQQMAAPQQPAMPPQPPQNQPWG